MHPPPDRRHRPPADRPTAAHPSQVILHSFVPSRLFGAASSLRALISPLEYRGVFIPLLPAGLMPDADARTLLFDCSTPYLIGVESALLAQLGGLLRRRLRGNAVAVAAGAAVTAAAPHM